MHDNFRDTTLAMYPEALIINMIRDPRASVWSGFIKAQEKLRRASGRGGDSPYLDSGMSWMSEISFIAKRSMFWKAWHQAGDCLLNEYIPQESRIRIEFSEMVNNPEECLEIICSRIGVNYDRIMLDAHRRRNDPVLSGDGAYAHQNIGRDIDPSRACSFMAMPARNMWVIEKYAREQMLKYGYQPVHPRISLRDRLLLEALLALKSGSLKRNISRKMMARRLDGEDIVECGAR